MLTTVEVLRQARALYAEAPSHAPLGTYPESWEVCAVTACGFDAGYGEAVRALAIAAGIERDFPRSAVIEWNAKATTADVLAAFDKAIATEEAKA